MGDEKAQKETSWTTGGLGLSLLLPPPPSPSSTPYLIPSSPSGRPAKPLNSGLVLPKAWEYALISLLHGT